MAGGEVWAELAEKQEGLVARRQLLELGLSPAAARWNVDNGRWQVVLPGVYATFTGPLSERARLWAALLHVGPPACASHQSALWLCGAVDKLPAAVHVSVPATRQPASGKGIRIHVNRRFAERLHPSASPPRTHLEEAVLDVAEAETDDVKALDTILSGTQRRLTTATRLGRALDGRPRHRRRALLREVLVDVAEGVASPLERRYAREVEARHGLPRGRRNEASTDADGRRWYPDVRYPEWRTVVELDGREAHPGETRFRDLRRDNRAAVAGERVLRYGWRDVATGPCAVAGQVAGVLKANGWPDTPRPCSPGCPLS